MTVVNNQTNKIQQAAELLQAGNTAEAEALLLFIIENDAEQIEARQMLAMVYSLSARSEQAIIEFEHCIQARPKDFILRINVADLLQRNHLHARAQVHLEQAVALKGFDVDALLALANVLIDQNEVATARVTMQRAMAIAPGDAKVAAAMGGLEVAAGNIQQAHQYYRQAIAADPLWGSPYYDLAFSSYQADRAFMDKAQQLFDSGRMAPESQVDLGFALAKWYDLSQQYEQGFNILKQANDLHRLKYPATIDDQRALFASYKTHFNQALVNHCQAFADHNAAPIFIVGLPRSGTTLTEQILARHPQVYGAGEVTHNHLLVDCCELTTGLPFPAGIETVPGDILRTAVGKYIARLYSHSNGQPRVIDKMPHNFFRMPLFKALLPNAKFILVERQPVDNCWSLYQHRFREQHGYSTDLVELGEYYRLYKDLVDHWDSMLPGTIYRLSYERLVTDTENELRKLLRYCELAFDAACLSPHQAQRIVTTPSATAVRQAIHPGAINSAKNYQPWLQPLITSLDDG